MNNMAWSDKKLIPAETGNGIYTVGRPFNLFSMTRTSALRASRTCLLEPVLRGVQDTFSWVPFLSDKIP